MDAEGIRVGDQLLPILMQPIPRVASSSSESDDSDRNSVLSSSDSDHLNLSDDENEDPLNVMDFHEGGPAEEDILYPLVLILMRGRRRANVQDFIATVHQKSDEEFRQEFHITRGLAYRMIEQLKMSGFIPDHKYGTAKKTAEVSFLMFLWYVCNKEPLRILANNFDMSESSVFRIIRRVVDWLMTLLDDVIKWPEGEEVQRVVSEFAGSGGIQNCIGAIGGCHMEIIKPTLLNASDYLCRKNYHSINLTAVVNAQRKFTMIYCGDPGSLHNTQVLQQSNFYKVAQECTEDVFPNGTFVIGDSGYQGVSDVWLVHPYRDNGHLTEDQRSFNQILSSARAFVVQAFGVLKGRFRRLLHRLYLFDIPFAVDLITVCCILHNLCITEGDIGLDLEDPDWLRNQPRSRAVDRSGNVAQMTKREALFWEMFGYFNEGWVDSADEDSDTELGGG